MKEIKEHCGNKRRLGLLTANCRDFFSPLPFLPSHVCLHRPGLSEQCVDQRRHPLQSPPMWRSSQRNRLRRRRRARLVSCPEDAIHKSGKKFRKIREEPQHKHKLFGLNFLRTDPYARMPRGQKVSPRHRGRRETHFAADVHDFWCGRP